MNQSAHQTRILFIDNDALSFQIWQCIASAIEDLPPIELFHAICVSDGLSMLEDIKPDAIVLNLTQEAESECNKFLDSLLEKHPPVVIQIDSQCPKTKVKDKVFYIERNSSLAAIHKTLLTATSAAKMNNTSVGYH